MNAQEIFTAMVTNLLTQGKQSLNPETGSCQYRGPDGLKCAVGFLIPDEAYDPEWDKRNAYVGAVAQALNLSEHVELLRDVQNIHDNYADPSVWPAKLAVVAEEHGLVMP